ncbi:MAG TPA: hypothetical protein VFF28_00525 [Candidatus Nanoarchaeia archaeon]|nr:hypothetical protein [Candidatus Nanoarchaeia archaeon]
MKKKTKAKPASKKKVEKLKPAKASVDVGFEEVTVKCPNCGKVFRVIKSSGFSMEGMLCQRCAAGGGIGLDQDADF